jgi:hypothetical protein
MRSSSVEMAASMIVPMLAVIALLAIGAVTDSGSLLVLEHVLMLAGMFAVISMRPEGYSDHHHPPSHA